MNKLLTIAIPTANSADILDKQLIWVSKAIQGLESECEILISDNCSTDHTQDVIKKWQTQCTNIAFNLHQQSEKLSINQHIIYCLSSAVTPYVWAIGDDNPILESAIAYVINKIKQHQNLSLLLLNFSGHNKITNQPVYPPTMIGNRWFNENCEDGCRDGKTIFENCFAKSIGSVIFLNASIYRTDLIKSALQIWPNVAENWIFLAYLAGYCAAHGHVIITKENYLECILGARPWQKEPKAALIIQYKHIPQVILKLRECGYSQRFCRKMFLRNSKEVDVNVFLGTLRKWPVAAIKAAFS